MKKYKIISPPFTLEFKEMSKKQLVNYYEWYIASIPERLNILIKTIKSTPGYKKWQADYTPNSLDLLGEWFAKHVRTRKMTSAEKDEIYEQAPEWFKEVEIGDEELTNKTFSLSIDIGMYMSQVFLKNYPSLKWKHIIKGSKNFVDYGQPVLEGFKQDYFNPVHILIVVASSLADRTKGNNALRELYDVWQKFIE